MTISVRESGMPMTVSRNSPSTNIRVPSTSRPSPTKNAVTVSRSATVIPGGELGMSGDARRGAEQGGGSAEGFATCPRGCSWWVDRFGRTEVIP